MRILNSANIICFNFCLFYFLSTLFFITNIAGAESANVLSEKEGGLYKATLHTPSGKINVILPDDMSAGDTISGTVIAEPSGADAKALQKNTDELNGYVVEIETQQKELGETKIAEGKLEGIAIPDDSGNKTPRIVVSDTKGKEILSTDIPVSSSPHPMQYPDTPSPGDFELPYVGQSGEPVQVMGPFDGKFDTSSVKIGNKVAVILAESPRKAVVQIPDTVKGTTTIEVVEKGVSSSGRLRIADSTAPVSEKSLNGVWMIESGKTTWRVSQQGQKVSADSIVVPEEDQIRGYKPQANIVRGQIQGNLLLGEIQQFFLMPIKQCMSMCPSKCEQWNEIKLVLTEDGNTLVGKFKKKPSIPKHVRLSSSDGYPGLW